MSLSRSNHRIQIVSKNWGYEKIIDNNQLYCGKILHVVKDYAGSVHYHKIKNETFFLRSGLVEIRYFDDYEKLESLLKQCDIRKIYDFMERVILYPGDVFKINIGKVHQLIGLLDSEVFEFSTQDFSEDSYRLLKGGYFPDIFCQ